MFIKAYDGKLVNADKIVKISVEVNNNSPEVKAVLQTGRNYILGKYDSLNDAECAFATLENSIEEGKRLHTMAPARRKEGV